MTEKKTVKITRKQLKKIINEMFGEPTSNKMRVSRDVAKYFRIDPNTNYEEVYTKYKRKAVLFKIPDDEAAELDLETTKGMGKDLDITIDEYVRDEILPAVEEYYDMGTRFNYTYYLRGRTLVAVEVLGESARTLQ